MLHVNKRTRTGIAWLAQLLLMAVLLSTTALTGPASAQEGGSGDADKEPRESKDSKDSKDSGTEDIQPAFGMELAAADLMLADTEHWQTAYRIATPSTMEVRCRFDKLVDYTLRFYLGKCCFIEKTATVQEGELKQVFDYYADEYGATDEATESSDKTIIFSRWKTLGREIELSASRRTTGQYLLTYSEFDTEADRKARRVQESELEAMAASAPAPAP